MYADDRHHLGESIAVVPHHASKVLVILGVSLKKAKRAKDLNALSPTEFTPIVIQLYLRSRVGLWEKYYYTLFDIMHYFSSEVGFTNIVVRSSKQSGMETKYGVPTVQGHCILTSKSHATYIHIHPHPPSQTPSLVPTSQHLQQRCNNRKSALSWYCSSLRCIDCPICYSLIQ